MKELEQLLDEFAYFIQTTNKEQIPPFYYDILLNYLGVTYFGARHDAIDKVVATLLEDHTGYYQPINRDELLSLSDICLVDCFSSAIYAYDDIHFKTTIHPSGVILSAILALARKQPLSLNQVLNALYIGMEMSCRFGILMLNQSSPSWYPTGIVGSISVVAALSSLLQFDFHQIKTALSLACNYASGLRGSHGSMTGSFIPAIACKNGWDAVMLSKNGFTCHVNSFSGINGLVNALTSNPAIDQARDQLDKRMISMETSCKPYPYGFIAFGVISLLENIIIENEIFNITVIVSSRVKRLGSNKKVTTIYDGFVSLPYIIAHILTNHDHIYLPLNNDFVVSDKEIKLMDKIVILEDSNYDDNQVKIIIDGDVYQSNDVVGNNGKVMTRKQVVNKFKTLVPFKSDGLIEELYAGKIDDVYKWLKKYIK